MLNCDNNGRKWDLSCKWTWLKILAIFANTVNNLRRSLRCFKWKNDIVKVPSWHVLDHTHIPYWFRWSPSGENATISQPRQLVVCLQSPQTVLFVFEMFVEEKKSIIGRNLADSLPFATQPHTSRHHTSTISKQNSRRRRIFKLSFFLYYSCYRQYNTIKVRLWAGLW